MGRRPTTTPEAPESTSDEETLTIKVAKLIPEATIPTRAYGGDLCFDLYTPHDLSLLQFGSGGIIKTGIQMELPEGYGLVIRERSSMGAKGVAVMGGEVDNGYRGEIQVILRLVGRDSVFINAGDRVAQARLVKLTPTEIVEVPSISVDTERGTRGKGSSGN